MIAANVVPIHYWNHRKIGTIEKRRLYRLETLIAANADGKIGRLPPRLTSALANLQELDP